MELAFLTERALAALCTVLDEGKGANLDLDREKLTLTILADGEPRGEPIRFPSEGVLESVAKEMRIAVQAHAIQGATSIAHVNPLLVKIIEDIQEACGEGGRDIPGTPTGFTLIDRRIAGMRPGDLIVVGSRPGMGRTAFALNVAEYCVTENELPVAFFSTESTGEQLTARVLGSVGRLNVHKLRQGKLSDDEWERLSYALGKTHSAPLYFEKNGCRSVKQVVASAKVIADESGGKLGLLVVDRIQGLAHSDDPGVRAIELSNIASSLKALGMELGCPVIVTSSLNRSLELRSDKRPMLADLRDSGAIEDEADVVLLIYRDEVYCPDTPDRGLAEIITAKQRNGPKGCDRLAFISECCRFEDLDYFHDE